MKKISDRQKPLVTDLIVNMAKKIQMSIKIESELHDEFMAVATKRHRPAAKIIQDLMRLYIAQHKVPTH